MFGVFVTPARPDRAETNWPWQALLPWLIGGMIGLGVGGVLIAQARFLPTWPAMISLALLVPFGMMIVGRIQKVLLAIIILEIPIGLDRYFNYHEAAAELGAIGGLNISVTTFCLVVLYALWFAELLTNRASLPNHFWRLSLPIWLYLLAVLASLWAAQNVLLGWFDLAILGQATLIYLYITGTTRSKADLFFIVAALFVALLVESTAMIAVRLVGSNLSAGPVEVRIFAQDNLRVGGTLGSPNVAGSYLNFGLATAFAGLMLASFPAWLRRLAFVTFAFGCTALLLTMSRGSWSSFALSIVLWLGGAWWQGWLSRRALLILLVIGGLGAASFGGAIVTRLVSDDNGAAYARIPLMQIAARMISDHPILGVGSNNAVLAMPRYITPEFSKEWLYTFHNKYLLVWAETGIGGILTFLALLASSLRRGWQGWQLADRSLAALALALAASLVGQMAHMGVDIFNSRPQIQMIWLLAGIITAIVLLGREERRRATVAVNAAAPSVEVYSL